ncbi:MAG: methionyl-tRNA formyltransferase [Planctomycetota bacterium]
MRIAFFGTPDIAVASLAALLDAGHDVACVVSQPDRPSGRRRRLTPPPVKVFAADRGLPVRQSDEVNDPAFVEGLAALEPQAIVVTAFGQILREPLLELPPLGCLNVHASLLPRHRGAAPVATAILAGDRETGVTLIRMVREMDAGPILAQESTPIGPRETTGELTERLADLGAGLLVRTLEELAAGRAEPTAQDDAAATYAPSFRKNDGAIDWTRPADYLGRFVRAMTPWPGAFTFWLPPGKPPLRLLVLEAVAEPGEAGEPARVAAADGQGIAVETGEGLLRLLRVHPAGKRPMAAADFLRGHPIPVGARLGWEERRGAGPR